MKAVEVREYGPLWRDSRVGHPRVREESNLGLRLGSPDESTWLAVERSPEDG